MALTKRAETTLSQQLARWQEASRATAHRACVAVANLPGAGGEAVGRLVAERLGFGCFGREIVDEIADRRGIARELMHGLDERVRSAIDRYVTDAFQERKFTESDYLKEVVRVVTTIDRRGLAVLIGRGAAFVLDRGTALRVLVVAPFEFRVERYAAERGVGSEEAAHLLREEDQRRSEFIHHHFGARIDDPLRFDLAVNTATLGIEAAAEDVVDVYRRHFGGRA
jgi:cytidylate kinase